MYRNELKRLLLMGIPGFVVGLVAFGSMVDSPSGIIAVILGSILFSSIPHGWITSSRVLGGLVIGSLPIMVVAFILRAVAAVLTGWVSYPIALLICFIRMRKEDADT